MICPRVHLVLGEGLVTVFSPVGLGEHVLDLLEVRDAGLVAHRFDKGTQAEIAGAARKGILYYLRRDLQTGHMNKPSFSTPPLLTSGGVGSGLCLSAVLLLSHRRGVWNWPKSTFLRVSRLFSTTCRETR